MGELFALVTAVAWAIAVILFARSGWQVPAFSLNLFRVGVGSALLLPTLLLSGGRLWRAAPLQDYAILVAVFILVFAAVFLEEPFTRRKAVAVLLAVGGILVVTLC
jgi:uncharacterized membrane protein